MNRQEFIDEVVESAVPHVLQNPHNVLVVNRDDWITKCVNDAIDEVAIIDPNLLPILGVNLGSFTLWAVERLIYELRDEICEKVRGLV